MLKSIYDYSSNFIRFSTSAKISLFGAMPETKENPLPDTFKIID